MMGFQQAAAIDGPKVLAAVISYNPDQRLTRHLQALRSQCDAVVVIDNGSSNLGRIEEASAQTGCRLVSNGSNLGVAAALSQAARMAQEGGFDWLATFDQDSLCPPGAINGLLELHERHPQRDRIGVLALSHRDRATGRDYHHRLDILVESTNWRSLRSTITSGSLVRVDLFEQIGLFDDALFIDAVDHEFCLRVRKQGWLVIEGRRQVLEHSIGDATEHRLLGRRIVCTHHSPVRRYYMTRNQLEVCGRNLLVDPVWATKGLLQFAAGSMAALIYETDKLAKFRAILTGMWHFALRRFGPRT
jgi:rhamnosyltransferase